MDDDAEIIAEFLVESHENLDQLDRDLVELERQPDSRERLSSIFRTIHTIKGTSGFLAFNRLEQLTHVGETLLSRLRDGAMSLDPAMTTVLLEMVDVLLHLANLGVEVVRLDAVAFLWKEVGTASIHMPQTHAIIQLLRVLADFAVDPLLDLGSHGRLS